MHPSFFGPGVYLMKRRFLLPVLAVVALAFAVSAGTAEAGRYYWPRVYRPGVQKVVYKQGATTRSYMVRQIDCRTLWDLGKQNGSWPKLP